MIEFEIGKILSIDFAGGRTHDFKLFKQSKLPFSNYTLVIADKGYQGIKKFHENSIFPLKCRSIAIKIYHRTSKQNTETL